MTWTQFFAIGLQAYGPPLIVFFYYLKSPLNLILAITGSFVWLLSMLIVGAIWFGATQSVQSPQQVNSQDPLTVFYSVSLQEMFRLGFMLLLRKAENGLHAAAMSGRNQQTKDDQDQISDLQHRLMRLEISSAVGFGCGFAQSLITFIGLWSNSTGPGTLFLPSCPSVSGPYLYAWMVSINTFINVTYFIIAFEGLMRRNYQFILWVVTGHFLVSYTSLLNTSTLTGGCAGAILIPALYLGLSVKLVRNDILPSPVNVVESE